MRRRGPPSLSIFSLPKVKSESIDAIGFMAYQPFYVI